MKQLPRYETNSILFYFFQFYVVDNGYLTANDNTDTSVRIKSLSPRQLGKYKCRAQNKLGSHEKEFVVTETPYCQPTSGVCGDIFSSASQNVCSGLLHLIGFVIMFITVK